jgi:hypothetical protein
MALEKVVDDLDTQAQLNPQYVSKIVKATSGFGGAGGIGGGLLHDDEGVSIHQQMIPGFSDLMPIS